MTNQNDNEKLPWWASLGIWVGVISTAIGILLFVLLQLNNFLAVSELQDFEYDNTVIVVYEIIDDIYEIPTAVTPPTPIIPFMPIEGDYNIILVGNDASSNRTEPDCDTCLLVHSDAFVFVNISFDEGLNITMVSIPRELYLHVDGIYDSQVRQLYARGGLEWIKIWGEGVLGIEIDGVMAIDMDGFVGMIDKMGGVRVVPMETFEDKCGDTFYTYEIYTTYELNGFETLCYARMRKYDPRGYFARQERHTTILGAIGTKFRAEFRADPLVTSVMVISNYFEYVETDMSAELVAQIVGEVALADIALGTTTITHNSISLDMLELYPRSGPTSPYLFKPTFVISEWINCLITNYFECE